MTDWTGCLPEIGGRTEFKQVFMATIPKSSTISTCAGKCIVNVKRSRFLGTVVISAIDTWMAGDLRWNKVERSGGDIGNENFFGLNRFSDSRSDSPEKTKHFWSQVGLWGYKIFSQNFHNFWNLAAVIWACYMVAPGAARSKEPLKWLR